MRLTLLLLFLLLPHLRAIVHWDYSVMGMENKFAVHFPVEYVVDLVVALLLVGLNRAVVDIYHP